MNELHAADRRRSGNRDRFQSGFTLIEMTVVIVILSVIAFVVLPRLPFAHERDLKTSARTLAASLRYLGDLAISTKQHYRLRITLSNNDIAVTRVIPEGEELTVSDSALNQLALRDGVVFGDIETPRLGKVTEGEAVLDFGPLGVEDLAVIHLKRMDDSRYFTVAVYPGSGRITVLEGYQEGALPAEDDEEENG
ncbi:MAG: type II secretion system protein [Deltaproteobacteria bacterium]|nr:type II secretion system protein [Deltaproteobacteria bacterium]TLN03422.1 MAG: prepilin-type N-terminal cleavage/methylation domain-containing protein [bacterium]